MNDFKKVVRVGITQDGSAFATIKFNDGKLSISGVVGPKANGDCKGTCGQWDVSYKANDIKPAPGWTASDGAVRCRLSTKRSKHHAILRDKRDKRVHSA